MVMGLSRSDLFPVSSEDLTAGKRVEDRKDVQSRFWIPPVRHVTNFTFVLRFERPTCFATEPIFRVFQGDELLTEITTKPKKATGSAVIQKSSLYTVYVCSLPALGVPYGAVIATWKPE